MKSQTVFLLLLCTLACVATLHVHSEDDELEKGLEKRKSKHLKQVEARRKQAEKRRKEEEKRRKEEEERRRKEREKQEEDRRKQEEHRRKEEEKRRKSEEERRRNEEERRQKEAEKRRKEEEHRRKEGEKRRQKELERQEKEREKQEKERQKQEEKRLKEEEKRRKEEEKRREEERKRQQWEREYQNLKQQHLNDKDYWKMKKDKKEEHYPKELKEKVEKGQPIKPDEEDKFENEYGRYKSRKDTAVIDLLNAINKGNDVENLDEGDIYKAAPDFDFRDRLPKDFCKDKKNKKLTLCKKGSHKKRSITTSDDQAWERRKRDGRRDRVYLWIDRIVPYEIDAQLEASRETIESAMQEIESKTCVKFVARSNQRNWIQFVKKSGCWSAVGRNFWMEGPQELSLGNGCIYKGIIIHEVMHALGFYHEQSRPDRGEYVEIFWENIQENSQHNFNKETKSSADMLGEPYDYSSIMHYGKYSFALDASKPTLLSIRNKAQELGQRLELSATDILQVNELYSCSVGGIGWSKWSSFGPCDTNCFKKRDRFCMDPKDRTKCTNPTSTTMLSWGVDEEKASCTQEECDAPINGHWNRWGSWGECSITCGKGFHSRTRVCTDPAPKNGGDGCEGEATQQQECAKISCSSGPYDCIFDMDSEPLCRWTQDASNNADWIRKSGRTPSSSTGPSEDHTTGSGYYLFMEASSPAQTGWKTRLVSPLLSNGDRCMKFAYHMYGQATGALSVKVKGASSNKETVAFSMSGDQLNEWKEAEFEVSSTEQYQVLIEAVRGNGFHGDIAIDDIVITDGKCGSAKENKTVTIPTVSKVGCYRDVGYIDGKRPFPQYKNFRSEIVWADYMSSLNETVLKCAAHAREHGFEYFGLEYYGECWTGPTADINFGRDGEATDCFPAPRHEIGPYLVGADFTLFVYKWINIEKKV